MSNKNRVSNDFHTSYHFRIPDLQYQSEHLRRHRLACETVDTTHRDKIQN